jgi:hypothetical protein
VRQRIWVPLGALLLLAGSLRAQRADVAWVAKASAPADVAAPAGGLAPVIVAPAVAQQWDYLYRFIGVEFVLCLEGHEQAGQVYIDGFRLARMVEAGPTSVRYEPCEIHDYVGTAHNHPPASGDPPACYRSVPDRESFDQDQKAVVDVVICGEDKWVWVLKDGRVGGTVAARAPGGGGP